MSKNAKVTLITHTAGAEQVIAGATKLCYSPRDIDRVLEAAWDEELTVDNQRRIKRAVDAGHHSVVEHASITFGIEGISRTCSHQLVRHRIASYSQQSQRYVKFDQDNFPYIIPPSIKKDHEVAFRKAMMECKKSYDRLIAAGIPAEDARFVLPNATETKIIVTMNLRSLLNFFKERCCARAQWEIRDVAMQMLKHAQHVCPVVFSNAGAVCMTSGRCSQGKSSGCATRRFVGALSADIKKHGPSA